jgi:hypothetical protein
VTDQINKFLDVLRILHPNQNVKTTIIMSKINKFKGSGYFRQRIVCSTLSGQAILIREIREREEKPGLTGTLTIYYLCGNSGDIRVIFTACKKKLLCDPHRIVFLIAYYFTEKYVMNKY